MTMLQFISLDAVVQEEIMKECGVYVAGRSDHKYVYDLYQVESFYVEFFYKLATGNRMRARVFEDTRNLGLYLKDIDISCLVS